MSTTTQHGHGIAVEKFAIDSLRVRLQKMTDAQLIEFGKAARFMCKPDFGRPVRQVFVIQLVEAIRAIKLPMVSIFDAGADPARRYVPVSQDHLFSGYSYSLCPQFRSF